MQVAPYKELEEISTNLTKNELKILFSYIEKNYSNKKYSTRYIYFLINRLLNAYENKETLEKIIIFLQKNDIEEPLISEGNKYPSLDKIITDFWEIYFSTPFKNISNINFLIKLLYFNQDKIEKIPNHYPIENNIEKYKNLRSIIYYLDWSFLLENITFADEKKEKIKNTQTKPKQYSKKIEEHPKISIGEIKEKFKENKIDISGITTKIRGRYWIDYSCSVSTSFIELFSTHLTEDVVKIIDNEESYTKLFWLWLIAIQNNPNFNDKTKDNYFNILSNKYSDLFMSLITEYFDFFMKNTENKHISNNLKVIKSHINHFDKKPSLIEYTKKIPKNTFKYLSTKDRIYLLQLIALEENNFKHIQSIIKNDEINIVNYLKILFSMDINRTMAFFMKFYKERGKCVNLYKGLIASFIDHNHITHYKIVLIDKIEQEYIKKLIVDFYNEFNESKDLVFHQSINCDPMDTGLWWYLKDEKILEELKNSENEKIARSAEKRLKPIYDEKSKNRATILKAISEGTKPLIITEGKTDWMHIKKALERFKKTGLYQELDINFLDYTNQEDNEGDNRDTKDPTEPTRKMKTYINNVVSSKMLLESIKEKNEEKLKIGMGCHELDRYYNYLQEEHIKRKVICIFDRDVDSINKRHATKIFNNNTPIYSFCIPTVKDENGEELKGICIEWYYKESNLMTYDKNNRRLFLGKEFKSEKSPEKKVFMHKKGRFFRDKKPNNDLDIFDKGIFSEEEIDKPQKERKNAALSKSAFAKNIVEDAEGFNNFDIDNFKKIFDIIEKIVND